MSVFTCIAKVYDILDPATTRVLIILSVISVCCWLASIRFCFILRNAMTKDLSKSKKRFFILMIGTCFYISIATSLFVTVIAFITQFFNPSSDVDYDTLCGKNGAFYIYYSQYLDWWIDGSINTSYICVLIVYYCRLQVIFEGSIYSISSRQSMIFKILIILAFLMLVGVMIFQFLGEFTIFPRFWVTFLIFYFFTACFIAFVLRQQFGKLYATAVKFANIGRNNKKTTVTTTIDAQLKMMIKFTVLTCFSLAITLNLFILSVILWNYLIFAVEDTLTVCLVYFTLNYIDMFISLFCLSLQYDYGYNGKIYSICCKRYEKIQIIRGCGQHKKNMQLVQVPQQSQCAV